MSPYASIISLFALSVLPSCATVGGGDSLSGLAIESGHDLHRVRGWPVLLEGGWALKQPELAQAVLAHLDNQLYRVERAVRGEQLDALRSVVIWVEADDPQDLLGGMCYHPDGDWLEKHGYDSRRAGGVEISDPEQFLSVTRTQPWVIMHELAHAYHHQVLSFENPEVIDLYRAAVSSGDYEETFRLRGRPDRHYALTNPMEYFAEGSEAYLGTNDFYPFVRGELFRHDPALAAYLAQVWGD